MGTNNDSVKVPLMGYDFPPSATHLLTGSQLQMDLGKAHEIG